MTVCVRNMFVPVKIHCELIDVYCDVMSVQRATERGTSRMDENVARVEDPILDDWNNNGEGVHTTVMRKWKWLFVHGCNCKSLVCTV